LRSALLGLDWAAVLKFLNSSNIQCLAMILQKTATVGLLVVLALALVFPAAANPVPGQPSPTEPAFDLLIYLVAFVVGVAVLSVVLFGLDRFFRKHKTYDIFK
jgi:hypothetical protein